MRVLLQLGGQGQYVEPQARATVVSRGCSRLDRLGHRSPCRRAAQLSCDRDRQC